MNKLVSIIIPIYNVEKYLDRCIESVVNQTYTNIEIILVNDGSPDKSLSICKKWRKKDSRIIIIDKENGGLSDARNCGIEKSKGQYLYFLDSDDFIAKNTIEIMINKSREHSADIVISNRYHFYDSGKKQIKFKLENQDIILDTKEGLLELNNFIYYDMSAPTKLFNAKLFKNIKFPYGKLCEDFYIMYKIFDKSKKNVYISNPLYYYYQREGSISKNKEMNTDFVIAAKEQMDFIEKKYPSLKNCVRTSYVSANMTIYNQVIRAGGTVPKNILKKLQKEVRKNIKFVLNNKNLIIIKKIQTCLFITNIHIYNILFKLYIK